MIIKGIALGFGMFLVGAVVYIVAMFRFVSKGQPALPPGSSVGWDVTTFFRHSGSTFLIALIGMIALGIAIVRLWPTRIPS